MLQLEEFRKKKAEERSKKTGSTGQENVGIKHISSDGATTSEVGGISSDVSVVVVATGDSKAIDSSQTTDIVSANGASEVSHNAFYTNPVQKPATDQEPKWVATSGLSGSLPASHDRHGEENNFYQPSYSPSEAQLEEDQSYLKKYSANGPSASADSLTSILSEKLNSFPMQSGFGFASTSNSGNTSTFYDAILLISSYVIENLIFSSSGFINPMAKLTEPVTGVDNGGSIFNNRFRGSINLDYNTHNVAWKSPEAFSKASSLDLKSAPLHSAVSETGNRRTRPSFLDSIVPRVAPGPQSSYNLSPEVDPFSFNSSKVSAYTLPSPNSQQPFPNNLSTTSSDKLRDSYETWSSSSISTSYEQDPLRQSVINKTIEFPPLKQEDDFSGLEQHIEDLTQEKFSLQRSLEASRVLAESLANENSSLTDSYNQQGAAVSQLKSDMESLQEEIRAHLLELDSVKMEYANAQLECSAADDRAKVLASEVIGLEEKALKLRSSELKLERQLEKSNDEIMSYRKKVSSLEKERQDLQLTIDAMREEKKLLQSKLRKASSEKPVEVKISSVTKNVSTSTEDLGVEISDLVHGVNNGLESMPNASNHEMLNVESFTSSSGSTFPLLPETGELHFPATRAAIPHDQLRTIGNINSLVSELALEKEELVRALTFESSQSLKLKELNKELSRKLEAQTQRLELLTAQIMANENIPGRAIDSQPIQDITVYTDEGDEVTCFICHCGRESLGLDYETFPRRSIKATYQQTAMMKSLGSAITKIPIHILIFLWFDIIDAFWRLRTIVSTSS
ncbi:hypothetical protein GIB67_024584 [Kingdonia uniflora]|uniref:Uncharacterized protein n=1 Tax=Kingdonia uniflora TaxID=39325 RepID=A0A7J7LP03_9MAGN|nr:hypothetical protein GIB67_024584 [Kingdonia uniflora]